MAEIIGQQPQLGVAAGLVAEAVEVTGEFEDDVELVGVDEEFSVERLRLLDAVILPGSKNSMRDMKWLWDTGLAEGLRDFAARGGRIFGICGGYQMLGGRLDDPDLKENATLRTIEGLGLLPLTTDFSAPAKTTRVRSGTTHPSLRADPIAVKGYEIHFGLTRFEGGAGYGPLFLMEGANPEGAIPGGAGPEGASSEGLTSEGMNVAGTYLHGVFESDAFRALWLDSLRAARGLEKRGVTDTRRLKERAYDALAEAVRDNLDVERLLGLMGL